jgi:hypothetical protein
MPWRAEHEFNLWIADIEGTFNHLRARNQLENDVEENMLRMMLEYLGDMTPDQGHLWNVWQQRWEWNWTRWHSGCRCIMLEKSITANRGRIERGDPANFEEYEEHHSFLFRRLAFEEGQYASAQAVCDRISTSIASKSADQRFLLKIWDELFKRIKNAVKSRHQYMEDAVGPDGMNRIRAAVQEQEELEETEFAEILTCARCKRRRVLEPPQVDAHESSSESTSD